MSSVPYCGEPPLPAFLWQRWNLDPVLIGLLLTVAFVQLVMLRQSARWRQLAGLGWVIAGLALVSPLCALSVSLFAARIGQHMILVLIAAPMIGRGLPPSGRENAAWTSAGAFTIAMWFWHMPAPYTATFHSDLVYWAMHLSIFASAILLWRDLLRHEPERLFAVLGAGLAASMLMGLLGAVITLAGHPLFAPHFATTAAWDLTPLEDQQLGGILMWVPAIGLFVTVSLLSFVRLFARKGQPAQ